MEAKAMHEFHATAEDELSFNKGAILKVNRSQESPPFAEAIAQYKQRCLRR